MRRYRSRCRRSRSGSGHSSTARSSVAACIDSSIASGPSPSGGHPIMTTVVSRPSHTRRVDEPLFSALSAFVPLAPRRRRRRGGVRGAAGAGTTGPMHTTGGGTRSRPAPPAAGRSCSSCSLLSAVPSAPTRAEDRLRVELWTVWTSRWWRSEARDTHGVGRQGHRSGTGGHQHSSAAEC